MLQRQRVIELTQQGREAKISYAGAPAHLRDSGHAHLDAMVDATLRLHFDTHDSVEIATEQLQESDFYFKRSYSSAFIGRLPAMQSKKIFPLGFNYDVLPDCVDIYGLKRGLFLARSLREILSAFKRAFDMNNLAGFQSRLGVMQSLPDLKAGPKVLFLAAAYDPYDKPDRSEEKIEERALMNEMRARCIALLRKELGSNFLGGFSPSRYARERYGNLIASESVTTRENHIKTLRYYPICVATNGLHGSTGWKLGEYVAFAKAIVSEKPLNAVPGNFEQGRNYLEFTSPDECVEQSVRLMTDTGLRRELMENNATYYAAYLRPDSLVLNALTTALNRKSGEPTAGRPSHRHAGRQPDDQIMATDRLYRL